jgi:transcriptional regulator with XRE-family HTH domain
MVGNHWHSRARCVVLFLPHRTGDAMSDFGAYVKARRGELGLSLRAFCAAGGLDPSNWSKMERGRLRPPQGATLERYAQLLGFEEGSDEWHDLFDLAAAEAGRVPEDLQGPELVRKLPVLFRTLRESKNHGDSDSEELLEELKRKIRDA